MVVCASEQTHEAVRETTANCWAIDSGRAFSCITGAQHPDREEAVLDRRKVDDLAAELHIWAAVELADAEEGGLHEREGGLGPFALLDDRLAGNIVVRFAKKIEIGNTTCAGHRRPSPRGRCERRGGRRSGRSGMQQRAARSVRTRC